MKADVDNNSISFPFTAIPNVLIDEVMPTLKDTEWRLLCVVARQTLGWKDGKGRKRRDWISQSQMIAKTGRNSAAISAALDVLVREDLLECCDSQGQPLETPVQRRRCHSRVYWSLATRLLSKFDDKEGRKDEPLISTPSLRVHRGWSKVGEIAHQNLGLLQNRIAKSE